MSGEQGRAEALSADERVAAVIAKHRLVTPSGSSYPACSGKDWNTLATSRTKAEFEHRLHVAAALRAEWEAQANTDRAAVEAQLRIWDGSIARYRERHFRDPKISLGTVVTALRAALATQPGEPS